jgi:hypothetical protein
VALTPSSLSTISGLLKQFYDKPEVIENVMISAGPLTAELLKNANKNFTGINAPCPIITGSGGGVGSQIATVSQYSSPAQTSNFLLTRSSSWFVGQIGQQVLEASANAPEGAFLADGILEVDAKKKRYMQYLAHLIYGDGTGTLFQLGAAAVLTNTYIQLDDTLLAAKVQVGDVLQYSNAGPGGTPGDSGAVGYVLGVTLFGASAGQISVSNSPGGTPTALSTIWPSIADSCYFVMAGDTAAAVSDGGTGPAVLQGIMAWTGTANLFGVTTRAQNPAFLSVQLIDCTANGLAIPTIRQSITLGVAQLATVSAAPKRCYLSPSAWFRLSTELQSQGMYPGGKGQGPSGEGSFGFSSLMLPTPMGDIEVIADPQAMCYLPHSTYPTSSGYSGANIAWLLETDTMEMYTMGEMGKLDAIASDDTSYFLRNGQGSYTYQGSGFGQLGFHAPGHSAVLLLPA